jgi:hypothetical protein
LDAGRFVGPAARRRRKQTEPTQQRHNIRQQAAPQSAAVSYGAAYNQKLRVCAWGFANGAASNGRPQSSEVTQQVYAVLQAMAEQEVVGTLSDGAHNGGGLTAKMPTRAAYLPALANPLTARMGKGINTTLDEGQTAIVEGK